MARALAGDSKIILLDEATANYDAESEAWINGMIMKNLREKTVLMITHKPDILRYLDRIILLQDGHIGDIGTHDSLYKTI